MVQGSTLQNRDAARRRGGAAAGGVVAPRGGPRGRGDARAWKPQPGSEAPGQPRPPPKPIEDLTALVDGNPRPRVVHGQLDAVAFSGHPHLDSALLRRVLARVVEQEPDQVVEPFRRCRNHVRIPAEPNAQPLLAGFGHGGKPLHRLPRHYADVDWFGEARARARLAAGEPEEIIDGATHPLAFLV